MRHIRGSKAELDFSKRISARNGDWSFHCEQALLLLIEDILRQMEKRGITRSMLAKQIGVSRSYVTQLLSGKPNLRFTTLFKICFAVGLKPKIRLEDLIFDDRLDFVMLSGGSFILDAKVLPPTPKPEKEAIEQYDEA